MSLQVGFCHNKQTIFLANLPFFILVFIRLFICHIDNHIVNRFFLFLFKCSETIFILTLRVLSIAAPCFGSPCVMLTLLTLTMQSINMLLCAKQTSVNVGRHICFASNALNARFRSLFGDPNKSNPVYSYFKT